MQAEIETRQDGSVTLELDSKAARAMIASFVFAARFYEGITSLTGRVEASLEHGNSYSTRRALCQ
jgi:hypothetical protein